MLVVSLLMLVHFALHWKWYTTVIRTRGFAKNRLTVTLTLVFLAVALSGYAPWLVHWVGGAPLLRRALVEVHDKLAIVLSIYLTIHVARNLPWFVRVARKLRRSVGMAQNGN
jgi:hypothetical protein